MSRRTAEASKAIREAWEKEYQHVLEGKGTRDWTPEQQQSIIDKGKAYDDQGRAFEGQHMKSVAEFPEYQGNPDNIQFLTKDEHLEAHKGNWQNPTNWYYDPVTKTYTVFGDQLIPCEVIDLNEPIATITLHKPTKSETNDNSSRDDKNEKNDEPETPTARPSYQTEKDPAAETARRKQDFTTHDIVRSEDGVWDKIKGYGRRAAAAVKRFNTEHPVLSGLIKAAGAAAGAALLDAVSNKTDSSSKSHQTRSHNGDHRGNNPGIDWPSASEDINPDDERDRIIPTERDYPEERSSPKEHDVSGYDRQQNGKTVHVNPYKRGGKNSGDE